MSKKALALFVVLVAVLAGATVASAATALSLKTAEKVARELAQKEVKGRNIVVFHITNPRRISSTRFVFSYDDRSSNNLFCTAKLSVALTNPSKGTISARVMPTVCKRIPTDALALEKVTATALKSVKGRRGKINASLAAFKKTIKACSNLKVPKSHAAAVREIVLVAAVEALEGPVDPQLRSFVSALQGVSTSTSALATARAAWSDYLTALHELPAVHNACDLIKSWAKRGYSGADPIDFANYNKLNARSQADAKAIKVAAALLARDGVLPQVAVAFTPSGLLLQLKIESLIKGF